MYSLVRSNLEDITYQLDYDHVPFPVLKSIVIRENLNEFIDYDFIFEESIGILIYILEKHHITLNRFSIDSPLFNILVIYYESESILKEKIRSYTYKDGYIYFVTNAKKNNLAKDLLGIDIGFTSAKKKEFAKILSQTLLIDKSIVVRKPSLVIHFPQNLVEYNSNSYQNLV
jgi:hypothetical protein